jgi:regulator of sirC expression with transglutaminase-like and TPR domain
LMHLGDSVVKDLEKVWEKSPNKLLQQRVVGIIDSIHFNNVYQNLYSWIKSGGDNLLQGAFLIAKYQYPDLDYNIVEKKLNQIIADVYDEICDNISDLEKIKILNHIIFEIHKYQGNNSNYFSPNNSYINQVLDSKQGNTVTLAIIYQIVARNMNLPVYGVNLPQNFILAFLDAENDNSYSNLNFFNKDVLFYINPFNKGTVLGRKEIDSFLKLQNISPNISYYLPCSNIETILRLINSLKNAYNSQNNEDPRINDLSKLERLFSEKNM